MNGFLLYAEYKEHFENFENDSDRVELLYAIFDYHSKRETKIVSKAVKIAFSFVKKELDRQILKYDSVCERNKANGSKGGRPITQNNPENPVGNLGLQNNPEEPKKPNTNSNTNTNSNSKENTNTKDNINKENIGDKSPATHKSKINNFKAFNEDQFKLSLDQYANEFPNSLISDFFDYWSEPDSNGKMRFQKQDTWELKRRLKKWQKNNEGKTAQVMNGKPQILNKQQRVQLAFDKLDVEIEEAKKQGKEIDLSAYDWLHKTEPAQTGPAK